MSDLERFREGRFLELPDDRQVTDGEGGSTGGLAGSWTGLDGEVGVGVWFCGGGAGTGLGDAGPGA